MTRYFEESLFGPKLKIECYNLPGNRDQTADDLYIKFRVINTTHRRVAKNCRAYLVALNKISNSKVVSQNLMPDSFQLSWAGFDFESRDIPAGVSHYVDLVLFSKHEADWKFITKPTFYASLGDVLSHRGTYRLTVVVSGDGAKPQQKEIFVDYDGDWKNANVYE